MSESLDDFRWLVSPDAAQWISFADAWNESTLALTARLRQSLSPSRVHAVLVTVELRRRATAKFAAADRMFFTKVGLEQATDEVVAQYKAGRFPQDITVADICCGIGGDLIGLSRRGPVLGIDHNPLMALLAEANARASGAHEIAILATDAMDAPFDACEAVHIDPDRRPAGRRTTHVELHEPGFSQLEQLRQKLLSLAVKLAPATELPEHWRNQAEWEWISRKGECRQLVAWFGSLTSMPGMRRATVLTDSNSPARTLCGKELHEPPIAQAIGRFLYEPDAAVLAAGLIGDLAAMYDLAAVARGIAYLTCDQPIRDVALSSFEVLEQLPFDLKRLRGMLRQRGIGRLEIKKRGVAYDPAKLRGQLALSGEQEATLVLTPHNRHVLALLCRRADDARRKS